ncbi:MAG: ABC transporter permease subunit [Acidobacteria bacterium]|nr:ABC transporter permease subunit [Acidobacteriota bacterium]
MRGLLAIYRREMGGYFVSPIAYVVVGIFLLLAGYFFYNILSILVERSFMAQMQAQRFGQPPEMDVPSMVFRNFFGIVSTIILFLIPMLTMSLYAEERKRGTLELLMTSPITELQIVMGKFLAALCLFVVMLLPTLGYHILMGLYSEPAPPWRVMCSGYLGVFLLGAALISLGSFISSLTESQIIAAVMTFALFLLLWVLDAGVRGATTASGEVLQYLSILRHFDDFAQGVIDTSSLVFYVSLSGLGIFLTLRTLDAMRWRTA